MKKTINERISAEKGMSDQQVLDRRRSNFIADMDAKHKNPYSPNYSDRIEMELPYAGEEEMNYRVDRDRLARHQAKSGHKTPHFKYVKESKAQITRLTESDLHRIIKESVNRIINEEDVLTWHNGPRYNDGSKSKRVGNMMKITRNGEDSYLVNGQTSPSTKQVEESYLHRIIRESVKKALNEMELAMSNNYDDANHTYSEREMKWLYDNQKDLSPTQRKVLNAGMWDRARRANYHGYHKQWPNVVTKDGVVFLYDEDGKLFRLP